MTKYVLYCLANAGGSATMYLKWKKHISEFIELRPIEIPGRGKRIGEPLLSSIDDIVNDIYLQMINDVDKSPYAIFGYSMGSLVGYELYRKLKQKGHRLPTHFFASSFEAPPYIPKKEPTYHLPDKEFKKEVLKYNGFPQELMNDESLMNYYLSVLRSDFEAIDTYQYLNAESLIQSNVTVLYGEDDNVSLYKMEGWKYLTEKKCILHKFKGGHFFIDNHLEEVITIVNQTLIPTALIKKIVQKL